MKVALAAAHSLLWDDTEPVLFSIYVETCSRNCFSPEECDISARTGAMVCGQEIRCPIAVILELVHGQIMRLP